MASIKNLKKDVDFLVDEVIGDCMLYLHFNQGKNIDEIESVLKQTVDLRNGLYGKINHPEGKGDAKQTKAHFKAVAKDLLTGVNDLFEQISKLAK